MSTTTSQQQSVFTLTIPGDHVHHITEMVRQQILGDQEYLRDVVAGREDPEARWEVGTRLQAVRQLADQLGLPEDVDRRSDSREPCRDCHQRTIVDIARRRMRQWLARRLLR